MPTLKEKLEMAKAEGARRMGLAEVEVEAVGVQPAPVDAESIAVEKSTTKKPKKNG
jgi:hypothetical protein